MIVEGDNYPPPEEKLYLSYVVQALTLTFTLTVAFGDSVCNYFNIDTPGIIKDFAENRWMYAIGGHFLGSAIATNLRNTGAFEIYVDDVLVFSKLETGEQPSAYALQAIFEPYGVNFIKQ